MSTSPDDILDLLAAYALGALEADEISSVHALLREHPELHATLAELQATSAALPYGLPDASPPPDLRQRVLANATRPAAPQPIAAPRPRARGWLWGLGSAAAIASLAAAIGWGQLFQARAELEQTQAALSSMRSDLASAQRVVAALQGGGGSGTMVQTSSGALRLTVKLPQLQPGRTYQLWQIHGSAAPVSAGLFSVDTQGFGTLTLTLSQPIQPGETLAITDEPSGGSPGPTTAPLLTGQIRSG